MSAYLIREAQLQDLENLSAIFSLTDTLHREAHPEIFQETSDFEIEGYISEGILTNEGVVFVAEAGGEMIGALIAWVRQTPENPLLVKRTYLSIENLVVAEDSRHQGVGRALMSRAERWAKECGIGQIELTVWDFNNTAINFYRKFGYRMIHHHMRKELP